ncbi:MAG: carbon starvation induced protein CsiD, partial [Bryobacterales bacterium]|nr:carbon starvation induced protein CsiD [Bryobacterales bacterium]
KAGAPIHEIAPATGLEQVASSSGRVRFPCHTDVAFLAPYFSPRGLLLYGLRNENSAPTSILPLERVLDAARPALTASLEKPIFRHPAPASFELALSVTAPVVWRDKHGAPRIAVQTHAVQPVNAEAGAAISELREILAALEPERVVVAPATALLFKNDRVLHGRSAFRGERWLQRAYFTDSIERFRAATGGGPGNFAFDARQLISTR